MDIDVDNNNIIRERSALSRKAGLRSSLIFLSNSSIPYYKHIVINNNMSNIDCQELIDCSQLSYEGNVEIEYSVRMVTDKHSTKENQCVCNDASPLKNKFKLL